MALLHCYGVGGSEAYLAHHLPEATPLLNHANNLLDELSRNRFLFRLLFLLYFWNLEECGKDFLLI